MVSNLIKTLISTFLLSIPFASAALPPQTLQLPHTFTYEAQTPQKITTGCRGTLFPESQETHQTFYIVDVSGAKKFVEPGSTVQVIFPFATDGVSNYPHKRQMVRFSGICFPSQCNAPSCGNIVGPLPYAGEGPSVANSQASNWLLAAHSQNEGPTAASDPTSGKSPTTGIEATHVNMESGSSSTILQTFSTEAKPIVAQALTKPLFFQTVSTSSMVTNSAPVSSGISTNLPGQSEGAVAIDAPKSEVIPQPAVSEPLELETFSSSSTNAVTTQKKPTVTGNVPFTLSVTPLIGSQSETSVLDNAGNTEAINPQAIVASLFSTMPLGLQTGSASSTIPAITFSAESSQPVVGSNNFPNPQLLTPYSKPIDAEMTPEVISGPSAVSATITTIVQADKSEAGVSEFQGSPVTSGTTSTSTFAGQPQNPDYCPASCSCCSKSPSQFSTNTITSSPLGSAPVVTSWPTWFPFPWTLNPVMPPLISKKEKAPVTRDASYYASLPGAIRGSTHVIYYPSCERNAYYQPAIVNFCSYPQNTFSYGKVTETMVTS